MSLKSLVIGTGSDHIYTADFDTNTGKLIISGKIESGKGPTWVLPEPQSNKPVGGRRFFAVNEFDDKIQTFQEEQLQVQEKEEENSSPTSSSSTTWKPVNEFSSLGSTPCFIALSPDARTLVCANYFENFSIFTRSSHSEHFSEQSGSARHFKDAPFVTTKNTNKEHGTESSADPTSIMSSQQQRGNNNNNNNNTFYEHELGPQSDRQEMSHPHMAAFSPHHPGLLLVADLGTDSILQVRAGNIVARVKSSKPGNGPRHLVYHPTLRNRCYVVNELASSISVFGIDETVHDDDDEEESSSSAQRKKFELTELETVSCLPAGKSSFDYGGSSFHDNKHEGEEDSTFGVKQNTCASINFLPSDVAPGKFLFVSCRGRDVIVGFELDARTGSIVRRVGEFKTLGRTPRFFCFSDDGKFMLVCNQDTDSIVVFKVNNNHDARVLVDVTEPVCFVPGVKSPQSIGFL